MKDGLVRADTLPLVFRAAGAEPLAARRAACGSGIGADRPADARPRTPASSPASTTTRGRRPSDAAAAEDDEPTTAGPLTIAIDVADDRAGRRLAADGRVGGRA